MKKFKMIVFTLMMASLLVTTVTLAQPQMGERSDSSSSMDGENETAAKKHMRQRPHGPLGQLVKFQHQNITIAVLAELTGLDTDTIETVLELSHPSEILVSYDIDMETFVAAMDARMTAFVEAAVAAGSITVDQGNEIIYMIINKPERPEPPAEEEVSPRFESSE